MQSFLERLLDTQLPCCGLSVHIGREDGRVIGTRAIKCDDGAVTHVFLDEDARVDDALAELFASPTFIQCFLRERGMQGTVDIDPTRMRIVAHAVYKPLDALLTWPDRAQAAHTREANVCGDRSERTRFEVRKYMSDVLVPIINRVLEQRAPLEDIVNDERQACVIEIVTNRRTCVVDLRYRFTTWRGRADVWEYYLDSAIEQSMAWRNALNPNCPKCLGYVKRHLIGRACEMECVGGESVCVRFRIYAGHGTAAS